MSQKEWEWISLALCISSFMYLTNSGILQTTGKPQPSRYLRHWLVTDWYELLHLLGRHSRPLLEAVGTTEVSYVFCLADIRSTGNSQDPFRLKPLKQRCCRWKADPSEGLTRAALLSGSVTGTVTWCDRTASASWNHQHLHLALAAGCLIRQSSSASRNFRGFISTANISLGLFSKTFLVSSFIPGYFFH